MKILHIEDGEEFVTRISGRRPAFWRIVDGRPVMLAYAITAFGREAEASEPEPAACCAPPAGTDACLDCPPLPREYKNNEGLTL